jgi:hypothetical protein
VEEAHVTRSHQLAGDRRGGRLPDELLELGDPLPVAEVLEEAAGIVGPRSDERPLARLGEVPLDAALEQRDVLCGERAADADGAVAPEVLVQAQSTRSGAGKAGTCAPGEPPSSLRLMPGS